MRTHTAKGMDEWVTKPPSACCAALLAAHNTNHRVHRSLRDDAWGGAIVVFLRQALCMSAATRLCHTEMAGVSSGEERQ